MLLTNTVEYNQWFYNEVEKIKLSNYFNTWSNVMTIQEENEQIRRVLEI